MRRRAILIVAAVMAVVGFAAANAVGAARSGVTIHIYQHNFFKGFVFSPKPRQCAEGRTVKLFKQAGRRQNPKRDHRIATTHASLTSRGKYRWDVRHYRPGPGRFYARVPATSACQADNSKTLHISARPNTKITGKDDFRNNHRRFVEFTYRGVGGISPYHFHCKLDDRRFRRCPNDAKVYTDLSHGHHVFKVRAIGRNGKRGRSPAKRGFWW